MKHCKTILSDKWFPNFEDINPNNIICLVDFFSFFLFLCEVEKVREGNLSESGELTLPTTLAPGISVA